MFRLLHVERTEKDMAATGVDGPHPGFLRISGSRQVWEKKIKSRAFGATNRNCRNDQEK